MYDIAIIGGGLVGASCGLSLIRHNPQLKILMIEHKPPSFGDLEQNWDSKIYAISPTNFERLLALGITPNLARVGTVTAMQVQGNAKGLISFNRQDAQTAYLAKIIEYRNLHYALWQQLQQTEQINLMYQPVEQVGFLPTKVKIATADNEYSASLLIAADGANSQIRQQLQLPTQQLDYQQAGVVANFTASRGHNNIAYQWFRQDGILALLPLPDQHLSMVWSTANYQQLVRMSTSELAAVVTKASGGVCGDLTLVTAAQAFPLKLNLTSQFYFGRGVVIGDAAHTIHPLAGQGVNLGFGDALLLAKLVANTNLKVDLSPILARYNYQRLDVVRQMQLTCHGLQRLFANRLPLVDQVRNLGLNLVDRIQPLKRFLISSAINS